MSVAIDPTPGTEVNVDARSSGLRRFTMQLGHQPLTVICLTGIAFIATVAALTPAIAPFDPNDIDVLHRLEGPSQLHWLGTDALGRDTLSRLLYGARTAVQTSFIAVGLAWMIGVPAGLLVGYLGGWWDRLAMRATDILQSIPSLIFAFAIIAILGRGVNQAAIAVAIVFAIIFARIARSLTLRERELQYVDAARVSGLSTPRILFREVLPNILGPLIVEAAIMLGSAIMLITMLSFLGLGIDAETPDWGSMLDEARKYQSMQPFMALPPGLAIMIAVLLFNFAGDGLRDSLSGRPVAHLVARRASSTPNAARETLEERPRQSIAVDDDALIVRDLHVAFPGGQGAMINVVSGVNFTLRRGETLGLVGESGSGKSMTALAVLGLVPPSGEVSTGEAWFAGRDLIALPDADRNAIRGPEIATIFQDPIAGFSPVHTIRQQLIEPLQIHRGLNKAEATRRAIELLDLVGVPNAAQRINDYPHQFSDGMAQRAMIALALSCNPKLLIADEPTTALDVTVQAQVLDLLRDLAARFDMSMLLITHDLGVVAETCDRVLVMYAGEIVEEGVAAEILERPRHPYTHALLKAMPRNDRRMARMPTIPGVVPAPDDWPSGCRFSPRCVHASERCAAAPVALENGVRCVRVGELAFEAT